MRGRAVLGSLWALALALPATAQDAAAPRAPVDAVPPVPAEWALHREGSTREVRYALYRRAAATLRGDHHAVSNA